MYSRFLVVCIKSSLLTLLISGCMLTSGADLHLENHTPQQFSKRPDYVESSGAPKTQYQLSSYHQYTFFLEIYAYNKHYTTDLQITPYVMVDGLRYEMELNDVNLEGIGALWTFELPSSDYKIINNEIKYYFVVDYISGPVWAQTIHKQRLGSSKEPFIVKLSEDH